MPEIESPLPVAGWYPDPDNSSAERWWNGATWGDQRRASTRGMPAAVVATAPGAATGAGPAFAAPGSAVAATPASGAFATASYETLPGPGVAPYGTPAGYGYGYGAAAPKNTPALVGFILALSGVVFSIAGLNPLAGGIVSVIGLRKSRELAAQGYPPVGRGFAIAGIIVGFVVGGLSLLVWIAYFGFIVWAIAAAPSYSSY